MSQTVRIFRSPVPVSFRSAAGPFEGGIVRMERGERQCILRVEIEPAQFPRVVEEGLFNLGDDEADAQGMGFTSGAPVHLELTLGLQIEASAPEGDDLLDALEELNEGPLAESGSWYLQGAWQELPLPPDLAIEGNSARIGFETRWASGPPQD